MDRQLLNRHHLFHRLQHGPYVARGPDADRVTQRHLVTAHLEQFLADHRHRVRRYLTLVGTSHHTAHVAAHRYVGCGGGLANLTEALYPLLNATVRVLLRECLRRRPKHRDLLRACSHRRIKALHVWRKSRVSDRGMPLNRRQHIRRIGHLRHPFGRNERCRLDRGEPRRRKPVDQLDLLLRRYRRLLVLKAISGADLDNPHALGVRQAGRQTAGAEAGVPATPRETSPRDHGAIGLNSDA
mmetsp:Transcript_54792/g.151054  ORF Transcript_54792/g.151054 Transcript_54792/m.151054 type:complete len:241 (-) Transcript_54792:69-791(-)